MSMSKTNVKILDGIIAAWVEQADAQGTHDDGNHRYTGRLFPVSFERLTMETIKDNLGRKWRTVAASLMELARRVDAWHPTDCARGLCREFYLSSTDKDLTAALGDRSTVSRTIDRAITVGMLCETQAAYHYGSDKARPKAYIYNPNAAAMLAAMMMDGPLDTPIQAAFSAPKTNLHTNRDRDGGERLFNPLQELQISSNICQNLGAGKGLQGASGGCHDIGGCKGLQGASGGVCGACVDSLSSGGGKGLLGASGGVCGASADTAPAWRFATHINRAAASDLAVLQGLHQSYPWLSEYQDRVDQLNTALPPMFRMSFTPKVKRGAAGRVSKVGIRCHSPFCQTLHGEFREAVLRDLGFNAVYSYDTKSSIYRITYLLNTGVWIDNGVDFYRLMLPRESYLSRETYKSLAQRLYFCHSVREVFNAIKPRPLDPSGMVDRSTMAAAARLGVSKDTEAAILARLGTYWEAMRGIVTPLRSEIFLHESCIYIDLLEALMARGYQVGQVYDGFYSSSPDIADACLSLLPAIAKRYLGKTGMVTRPEPLGMRIRLGQLEDPPATDEDTAPNPQDPPATRDGGSRDDNALDGFLDALFGDDTATPKDTPPAPQVSPHAVDTLLDSLSWLGSPQDPPRPKHDRRLGLTLEALLDG